MVIIIKLKYMYSFHSRSCQVVPFVDYYTVHMIHVCMTTIVTGDRFLGGIHCTCSNSWKQTRFKVLIHVFVEHEKNHQFCVFWGELEELSVVLHLRSWHVGWIIINNSILYLPHNWKTQLIKEATKKVATHDTTPLPLSENRLLKLYQRRIHF